MKKKKAQTDQWITPAYIMNALQKESAWQLGLKGKIFDPCPYSPNFDPATDVDGLAIDWPTNKLVYVNPPFSKKKVWVDKCIEQSKKGVTVYLLLPFSQTEVVRRAADQANCVAAFLKRIPFERGDGNKPEPAMFDCALFIFNPCDSYEYPCSELMRLLYLWRTNAN